MLKKLFIGLAIGVCSYAQITVTTTIYPLYSVVKEVGGKTVKLNNLVPFGVEPHEFEPTAKSMKTLVKSDIYMTSGDIMEPWSSKIVASLKIEDKVFDMSKRVKLRTHKEYEGGKTPDPHYWLSFDNYILMIKETTSLLSKKDSANAKAYEANAEAYIKRVAALQNEYETLKMCKNKKVVVNHDAFGYLANDYGITQYSISGMTPESKPSAKQIAKLIEIVKKEKIGVVFFEEFASDKTAKTIAKEAKVKIDALRPVENITNDENNKNIGYIEIMRANLEKLKGAMDCK
ncbi:MAG TPA: metal ABC transporter substrate-binding protein [Campylobacterales bacterium]|nr:metal ABC transporter substrate-binding protein [Campylobacterales bacterium]